MDKKIESITSMEIKEGFVNNEQQDIKIVDFPSQTVFEPQLENYLNDQTLVVIPVNLKNE